MPYQDTQFTATFQFLAAVPNAPVGSAPGLPIDLTTATFVASVANTNSDGSPGTVLLTLSTNPSGGLSSPNPQQGLLQMIITKAQTKALPLGTLVFDVMRTDLIDPVSGSPEPQRYTGGYLYVKQPVTVL
jgi:hypothetical protein